MENFKQSGALREAGDWLHSKRTRYLSQHRNAGLELVLVTRGSHRWNIDGEIVQQASGSILFTLPWQIHGPADSEMANSDLFFIVIGLDQDYDKAVDHFAFHPDWQISADDAQGLSETFIGASRQCWPASDLIIETFPVLTQELKDDTSGLKSPLIQAMVKTLLFETALIIQGKRDISQLQRGEQSREAVRQFLETLKKNPEASWSLESMASQCDLGIARFAAIIRELTGDKPMTYLNRQRLSKAKKLLKDSNLKIKEIAEQCGFSSSQYFATVFKQFEDGSPGEYRRSKRCL